MYSRHKFTESGNFSKAFVDRYLLGTLDDQDASLLEQRYFMDPAFFNWVWTRERELILRYLHGDLSEVDRKLFENRYLEIPALNKRLKEVESTLHRPRGAWMRWSVPAVITVVLLAVAIPLWLWTRGNHEEGIQRQHRIPAPAIAEFAEVRLAPGLTKGNNTGQVEFPSPKSGTLRLRLELPGRTTPVQCRVVIAVVGADSKRQIAWSSGATLSLAAGHGQDVRIDIEPAKLPPGDYIGIVETLDGQTLETYSFRVDPAIESSPMIAK
ncbi:MAG TPA: hypothetical protein VKU01_34580 [Bryobacteraceae bacterium]|nr:hypothetical protein [Bryobacteraceae bacterium]